MKRKDFVQAILSNHSSHPSQELASAYAPSNIALCKYWGKRDAELNLPVTSSFSISLAERGATTLVQLIDAPNDEIILGDHSLAAESIFAKRVVDFLDLFRPQGQSFRVKTDTNIPVAAGLASSAAGFAALTLALNLLFDWQLDDRELSLLARLGSGSACRSFWHGFVEWHGGEQESGMDSYAEPLDCQWPELNVGLLVLQQGKKSISSREAMRLSKGSRFYQPWPDQVAHDLPLVREAALAKDFETLGQTAESNALAMHAIMLTAAPAVCYWQPETLATIQKIWQLRQEGLPIYFTQDAGPNLKLLFQAEHAQAVHDQFAELDIVSPFGVDY